MIFAQSDRVNAQGQLRKVADGLRKPLPAAATPLDDAAEDLLAHKHFPNEDRRQLHSTNSLERLVSTRVGDTEFTEEIRVRQNEEWRRTDFLEFRGKSWNKVSNGGTLGNRLRYLLNAYRALLTRARQGMVIFVPPWDPLDPTRRPDYYDETYEYLAGLGLSVL